MRKGLEFLQYAVECRKIAHQLRDPQHRQRLEAIAQAWETLASERATQLGRENRKNGAAASAGAATGR